jgi:hypothetical protein
MPFWLVNTCNSRLVLGHQARFGFSQPRPKLGPMRVGHSLCMCVSVACFHPHLSPQPRNFSPPTNHAVAASSVATTHLQWTPGDVEALCLLDCDEPASVVRGIAVDT